MSARLARVVAPALVAAGLAAPVTAGAAPRATGWVITRTAPGAAVLEGELNATAASSEATVTMFALKNHGKARRVDYRFATSTMLWGLDGHPEVYGPGIPRQPCVAGCSLPTGVPGHLFIHTNGHAIAGPVYVAAWDAATVTITLDSPGWRVTPWRTSIRVLTPETSGGSGVTAAHASVGWYTGGSLPGGPYGSTALTFLPCDDEGSGTGQLHGYWGPHDMECPHFISGYDGVPFRWTWRVTADAFGMGSFPMTFAVVDWPRG
jgi:hypothetical protein